MVGTSAVISILQEVLGAIKEVNEQWKNINRLKSTTDSLALPPLRIL